VDQADSLRHLAAQGRLGRPPLQVLAVTSGKGGVGKTNMTANLATLAARAGKRVLVIDADLGLANVEILLGMQPTRHLGHLIDGSASITDVLALGPHGIHLLPAGSGVPQLTQLNDAAKMNLMANLDALAERFDVVFIDTGAGIGDNVLFFVGAAQEAILVVNPEPTALVDAYAAIKVFSQDAGVQRFAVIVNPVVDELSARDTFPRLTAVANRFLKAKIRHLGYVPRDENVHKAVMARRPVVDMFPMAPASRALVDIADRLFNGATEAPLGSGLKFMWQRLLRESAPQAGIG
jgi:flagellar biosynthesis protein FlhG